MNIDPALLSSTWLEASSKDLMLLATSSTNSGDSWQRILLLLVILNTLSLIIIWSGIKLVHLVMDFVSERSEVIGARSDSHGHRWADQAPEARSAVQSNELPSAITAGDRDARRRRTLAMFKDSFQSWQSFARRGSSQGNTLSSLNRGVSKEVNDAFLLLGLQVSASPEEIQKAYEELILKHTAPPPRLSNIHDQASHRRESQRIQAAYTLLMTQFSDGY